jgi:hypothetical protein
MYQNHQWKKIENDFYTFAHTTFNYGHIVFSSPEQCSG